MVVKINSEQFDSLSSSISPEEQLQETMNRKGGAPLRLSADDFAVLDSSLAENIKQSKDDDTFLDKLGRSYDQRTGSMGETIGSYFGGDKTAAPDMMTAMGTPEWEAYNKGRAPTTSEALTQLGGDIVGAAFDVVGAGIAETVDNLWSLSPESFRQDISKDVKDAAMSLAATPLGKKIAGAVMAGGVALDDVKQNYPQEYKTFAKALNIVTLGRGNWTSSVAKTQPAMKMPMVINKADDSLSGEYIASNAPVVFGTKGFASAAESEAPRSTPWKEFTKTNKPETLSGRDKDVWEVIVDDSPKAIDEATSRGRYSDPNMTGTEHRLLSKEEALQVEAVKRIKEVNPLNTFRQNLKHINTKVSNIGKAIEARLSNFTDSYSWPQINVKFQKGLDEAVAKDPTTYRNQTTLKNYEELTFKAKDLMDKNGTDALGIHKTRQEFARYYYKLAGDPKTWEEGVNEAMLTSNFKSIYRQLNKMVDEIDGGVTANMRAEQSNLIAASQVVAKKAASQDTTAVGRLLQNLGIVSHGRTSVGRARALQYDLPVLMASPFLLLLNPIRKATTKATPFRETVGEITYGVKAATKKPSEAIDAVVEQLKYLRKEAASSNLKGRTKEQAKRIATDMRTVNALISALEEGTYEPNEFEQQAIQQWLNQ